MDKTITTALLIVVSMILVVALYNIAFPAIVQGGEAVTSMANTISDRMKEGITLIHASSELDSANGFLDPNGNGLFEVNGWVKNTGSTRIVGLNSIDVFFGPEGNFVRIPSQANAGGSYPYWTYNLGSGATDWIPSGTLQIAIHYQPLSRPAAGRYYMKIALPTGISADYVLGI